MRGHSRLLLPLRRTSFLKNVLLWTWCGHQSQISCRDSRRVPPSLWWHPGIRTVLRKRTPTVEGAVWIRLICTGLGPAPQLNALPDELQLTFSSCNICWALAAVTSLSSLRSFPPTVWSAVSVFSPPPPPASGLPAPCRSPRPVLWRWTGGKRCWLGSRTTLVSCWFVRQHEAACASPSVTSLSRVSPSTKWHRGSCNELMVLCRESFALMMLTTAVLIRYWLNCAEKPHTHHPHPVLVRDCRVSLYPITLGEN